MKPDFVADPYTDHCARMLERADHALIGLSPWNSYFTPVRVEELIAWAVHTFRAVDVFIPSYEAAYTLIAAGADPLEAVGRARRAAKKLRGPARRALQRAGLGDAQLHTGCTLAARPRYASLRRAAGIAYRKDPTIRQACRDAARCATTALHAPTLSEAQLDTAARYAIAELPVLMDSPAIFDIASSVTIYHRPIALIGPLLEGTTSLKLSPEQGFAVVTPRQGKEMGHEYAADA